METGTCLLYTSDNTLALFENQYPVQPMGVSYNSYVILDEKTTVMDSVDGRAAEEWLSNVARVLEGRSPDYLVVTHLMCNGGTAPWLPSFPRGKGERAHARSRASYQPVL